MPTQYASPKKQQQQTPQPVIPVAASGSDAQMPLLGNNFLWMGIALVLIVVGFALMGGAPSSLEEYNADIFSTRRIIVGPAISFVGFVLMAVAIAIKPKQKKH